MTRELAVECARNESGEGKQRAVYRFRAWPEGVFGVRDPDRLPREAETFEIFGTAEPVSTRVEPVQPRPTRSKSVGNKQPQGGLF